MKFDRLLFLLKEFTQSDINIYNLDNSQFVNCSGWYIPEKNYILLFHYAGHHNLYNMIMKSSYNKDINIKNILSTLKKHCHISILKNVIKNKEIQEIINKENWIKFNIDYMNAQYIISISASANTDDNTIYDLYCYLSEKLGRKVSMLIIEKGSVNIHFNFMEIMKLTKDSLINKLNNKSSLQSFR